MKTIWRITNKLAGRVRGPQRMPSGGYLWANRRALALLGLLAALSFEVRPQAALAANSIDPSLQYRTITSARFRVHYPAPDAFNLAVRISRIAERALAKNIDLLGYTPRGVIDIVLSDAQDDANGSAEVFPKNTLRLFLSAPAEPLALYDYDDWFETLLIHELAHIVDIDQTHNVSAFLRRIFGKTIQYNAAVSQSISEGVAVFAETELTQSGRGRSAYVSGALRVAALDGVFVSLDQAHLFLPGYPGGNAAYFYGGRFHLFLATHFGTCAVGNFHRQISAQPTPYLVELASRRVFHKSLLALWEDFAREEYLLAKEIQAEVARFPALPTKTLLSASAEVRSVRYLNSKTLVYSQRSSRDGASVRLLHKRADGRTTPGRVLLRDALSAQLATGGGRVIAAQANLTHRFDSFNDLIRTDVMSGRQTKLFDVLRPGQSLRGRDPALSPDGHKLAFIENRLHQSFLVMGTWVGSDGGMSVTTLVAPWGDTQQATPAWSPDQTMLALSITGGKAHLNDAYVQILGGEAVLIGGHIAEYEKATFFAHAPGRSRKLLLHRRQIEKLHKRLSDKGMTAVALSLYFSERGHAKVELGIGKGKQEHDKRDDIRDREASRELARVFREHNR